MLFPEAPNTSTMIDLFNIYGLSQLIDEPTRATSSSRTLIDLGVTNSVKDPKGNLTAIEGVCDVPITVELKDGKSRAKFLRNVLYGPNFKVNLLSVNKAVNFGHGFIFNDSRARIIMNDGYEYEFILNSGLFILKVTLKNVVSQPICWQQNKAEHQRRH